MMFFQDGEYPTCAEVIRKRIVGMSPKSQVYKALVECCESKKFVEQLVSAGTYPRVKIEKLYRNGHWVKNVLGIYQGECKKETLNYVFINEHIGRGVEGDRSMMLDFERLVLHEAVHWARYVGGKPGLIGGKEAGSWFVHRAYGVAYIGHSDIGCS